HPSKPIIIHADFQRVSKSTKLHTSVPLHFINEANSKGVKEQGGKIVHNLVQLEITCLPANLPEFIEVDIADMEVGQILHISDLILPKVVSYVLLCHVANPDLAFVTMCKLKDGSDEGKGESARSTQGPDRV